MASKSPIAEAAMAAQFLVRVIDDLRHLSMVHGAKGSEPLASLYNDAELEALDEIAFNAEELQQLTVELAKWLAVEGVADSLGDANVVVASLGDYHAQSYCVTVRQIGHEYYGRLIRAVDPEFFKTWRSHNFEKTEYPTLSYQQFVDAAEDVLKVVGEATDFDFQFARQAIAKEWRRASGAAPVDTGPTYPNEPRDAWIYSERKRGQTLAQVLTDLDKRHLADEWDQLATEQAIFAASKRYAIRKNLPQIKR